MAVQIQWRRDTAANWTAANPTLAQGEAGLETDTGRFKLGDGATAWVSLAYFTDGVGIGALSAGTQSVSTGTVVFSNSNGITFGMSGSSRITASHNGLTSQSNQAASAGNGSFTFQTLTFADSNGVSFSTGTQGLYATVKTDYLTTQSGQAFSADASSTFQTLTFQNSNGVSFSNNAGALRVTHDLQFTSATSAITSNALNTSASRVMNIVAATNNTAGGTASLSSNVSFSAANGITFYTSAGNAVVASHNALTTARASTDAIGLNTAQTNVTWTVNSSGLSINAAGYAGTTTAVTGNAVLTLNSLGLRLDGSGLAGTSTGFAGANISGSMTMNTAGLNLSLSVAAPGAAAENNWINLLGAQTAGNTTASGSTIGWSALGNATLSGTNGSQVVLSVGQQLSAYAVSNTVSSSSGTIDERSISFRGMGAASVGVSNGSIIVSADVPMLSRWSLAPEGASSAGSAMTQGSMSFQRVFIPRDVSFSRVDIPVLISIASSATANTGNLLISSGCVIYSVSGTSTLNPIVGQFGTTTYTHASNSANWNSVTGPRLLSFNLATRLSGGEYYVGVQLSTNNNSSIGTATTADPVTISLQHGAIYTASQWQEFGAVTATSVNMRPFVGVAASVTATNQTQQMSNITQTGTALMRANIPVIFRNF